MVLKEPVIVRTWKGNKNGSILLTLPDFIKKEYQLEEPAYLILERQKDSFTFKKLALEKPLINLPQ